MKVDPTLDDPVDQPERGRKQNRPADKKYGQDSADDHPEESVPEGPYLPLEVAFNPASLYIFLADIVDDNPGEERQRSGKKADCLQGVNDGRQLLQVGFAWSLYLFLPFVVHYLSVYGIRPLSASARIISESFCLNLRLWVQ